MDITDIKKMFDENEKPLDNLVEDGGYCKIFRTIGCVGDSLSSGEFESLDEEGNKGWHDMYEYSWGQYIARTCGSKVYNFSRGGMSAKWYMRTFADEKDFWNKDKACQAYIFALGVNDLLGQKQPVGSVEDIKDDWFDNNHTFAGYYGAIIQRLKEIQPHAKFFLMTMPYSQNEEQNKIIDKHADLLYDLTKKFKNMYVLDIRKYGPVYDSYFREKFFMSGHLNPMGYIYTAKIVMSYIDYIIRHDMENFKQVPFIGTNIKNVSVKAEK